MKDQETKKPNNPQAFPQTWEQNGTTDNWENGMSLRDYLAAKAMQGYCGGEYTGQSGMSHEQIAEWSFGMADAMLKQREL